MWREQRYSSATLHDLGKLGLNEIVLTVECIFWGHLGEKDITPHISSLNVCDNEFMSLQMCL